MLKRLLYKTHRWGGVALAVFMVFWLVSGLIIIYTSPIIQSRGQHLAHTQTLNPETGWLSLGEAWQRSAQARAAADATSAESPISSARLLRVNGTAQWVVVDAQGRYAALSALDGSVQSFSPVQAEHISEHWLSFEPPWEQNRISRVTYVDTVEATTSLRNYQELGPFHRVAVNDGQGTELLVSARTGEVLQAATAWDRGLYQTVNWLHFFRFLEQPGAGETRRNVLLWLGFTATVASLTGMIIGWLRWRPGYFGKSTYPPGRTQPYRTFFLKWHFWAGFIGGTFALLWTFSGYINGNPWQVFSPANANKAELARFQGKSLPISLTEWKPEQFPANDSGDVVELAWQRLGDQAVLLKYDRTGHREPLDIAGAVTQFDDQVIKTAAQRLIKDVPVASLTLLNEYDNYYYLYHNRDAADKPLPVVRVELADAGHTYLYVDPQDGRLLSKLDASRRTYRWLFSAIHRWDFPGLYLRPVWDMWMLTWIGFGLALTITSSVLAWRRLRRTFGLDVRPVKSPATSELVEIRPRLLPTRLRFLIWGR